MLKISAWGRKLRSYVSGIERGERNPSLTNILKRTGARRPPI